MRSAVGMARGSGGRRPAALGARARGSLVVLAGGGGVEEGRGQRANAGRAGPGDRAPLRELGRARRRGVRRVRLQRRPGSNAAVAAPSAAARPPLRTAASAPTRRSCTRLRLSVATIASSSARTETPPTSRSSPSTSTPGHLAAARAAARRLRPARFVIEYNSNFPAAAPVRLPRPRRRPEGRVPRRMGRRAATWARRSPRSRRWRAKRATSSSTSSRATTSSSRAPMRGARGRRARGAGLERRAYAPVQPSRRSGTGGARARWAPPRRCPHCRRAAARRRARAGRGALWANAPRGAAVLRAWRRRDLKGELLARAEGALPAPQCVALPRRRRREPVRRVYRRRRRRSCCATASRRSDPRPPAVARAAGARGRVRKMPPPSTLYTLGLILLAAERHEPPGQRPASHRHGHGVRAPRRR